MWRAPMDYRKHYDTLITRAKSRIIEGYVEKHHIIPECLGGTDDISNLVALTPEEHYVAHQLLCKMHPDNPKLLYAAKMMCVGGKNHSRNNKCYGWLKRKRLPIGSRKNLRLPNLENQDQKKQNLERKELFRKSIVRK